MNKEYKDYLKSDEWAEIRCDMIEIFDSTCQVCFTKTNNHSNLQVHHLTYENLFNEEPEDLVLLCKQCHSKVHGYSVPKKKKLTRKFCTKILKRQFGDRIRYTNCSWRYLAKIIKPGYNKRAGAQKIVKEYVQKFMDR